MGGGSNVLSAGKRQSQVQCVDTGRKTMDQRQMRVAYCGHQGQNGGR